MAEMSAGQPATISTAEEEALFYHETTLNAAWTGARLALGALSFGFGAFVFAYFYLLVRFGMNSFAIFFRTRSANTSAPPPGSESRPAAISARSTCSSVMP